jgi:hypothetical protein
MQALRSGTVDGAALGSTKSQMVLRTGDGSAFRLGRVVGNHEVAGSTTEPWVASPMAPGV